MPELPEVETTRRGIAPHLEGRRIEEVVVRHPRLRWPVPVGLADLLPGRQIHRVARRAKYLLMEIDGGTLILHLGMSGSLRCLSDNPPPGKHDHFDLRLEGGVLLRLTDPRRFGAVLWTEEEPARHPLLASLGPEPLDEGFDGNYLHAKARGRKAAVKPFLMDGKVVVGVGNIYASESLFLAGIHPEQPAGEISARRYGRLATAVKEVLAAAIAQGGTTLRDFVGGDGRPGYFAQRLNVYGREGERCFRCNTPIERLVTGQRSSFYCPRCQRRR